MTKEYYSYDNPFVSLREFFSLRARNKMYRKFIRLCEPGRGTRILDLGETPDVRLKDSNFLEKLYPYKENIVISSIEDCSNVEKQYGLGGFVLNRPREKLPFRDEEFDICFCSAVLEHVGTNQDQIFFLNECIRVAKQIFITTPNRFFPVEMHTFLILVHWLPWNWFQKIVKRFIGPFYAGINNLNLLSCRSIKKLQPKLIKEISLDYIRTFGFKSNLIIVLK